jgi:hypothetical protein
MTKSTGVGRGRPKGATNVSKHNPGQTDIRKMMFTKQNNITEESDATSSISTQHISEEQVKASSQPIENNVSDKGLC